MNEFDSEISSRKADHIRINLEEYVQSGLTTGLEYYRFTHDALPELDLDQIDSRQILFNRALETPLLISSMTGGAEKAEDINRILSQAAQECKVALGLGSQRAALEFPELGKSFQIRKYAPDILLFANIGAVQLNYVTDYVGYCLKAVEQAETDALFLHLNPLQEALQPEGDTHFGGLLEKIGVVARSLPVPVIIKEVGWGISAKVAAYLFEMGVAGIDVAGAGGTSWAQVEKFRMKDRHQQRVAASFRDWGIPTAESIVRVRQAAPKCKVFASGGIRNGVEVAKCIALGADLVGCAGPFLKAAMISVEETIDMIHELTQGLRIAMFVAGVKDLPALKDVKLEQVDRR